VRAEAVVEQRVTHFLMGLALIGTATGPLLLVLHTMPTAVFAGVFFIVGTGQPLLPDIGSLADSLHSQWGSIESNGIKIWLYIAIQFSAVAACVAISHTLAAVGFPVLVLLLIPLRNPGHTQVVHIKRAPGVGRLHGNEHLPA